jgi:DNA-binding NarL/FixJ family response regulator
VNKPVRVLLVDDHVLFRKGVEAVLATRPGVEVVGEASNGYQAIQMARETAPDVILMDICMPECNGLEATRKIKSEMPHAKILMLTVSEDDKDLFEAIKCGAQGYLIKNLKAHLLFDMLDALTRGETPVSAVMATKILHEFHQPEDTKAHVLSAPEELTAREIEVLELIVAGQSNKEIAKALVISESTVKNHLRNILEKLHLRNRIQAAVYAVRKGLVSDRP